jgi:hypothetical protein
MCRSGVQTVVGSFPYSRLNRSLDSSRTLDDVRMDELSVLFRIFSNTGGHPDMSEGRLDSCYSQTMSD